MNMEQPDSAWSIEYCGNGGGGGGANIGVPFGPTK